MELLLAPVMAFLAVALLAVGLFPNRRLDLEGRLAAFTGATRSSQVATEGGLSRRIMLPALESIGRRAGGFASTKAREETRQALDQAGSPLSLEVLLGLRIACAIICSAGYLLLVGAERSLIQVLTAGALAYLGGYAPKYWLARRAAGRQRAIRRSLPDALDLVVVSMEAGLALDAALAKVVEKVRGPLAEELQRALREVQLGVPRREALRKLAGRCGVKELGNLVRAIIQADEMGVSMAELMRTQADETRVARRQRAQEQANQAAVKMVIPLALFILPSVLIVAAGPAILTVYHAFFAGGGVFK